MQLSTDRTHRGNFLCEVIGEQQLVGADERHCLRARAGQLLLLHRAARGRRRAQDRTEAGWADKTVRVIVPILIIDELDGLKRSGETLRRWRARHTLKVIEDALASPPVRGLLRNPAPDGTRGGVILDLLFDPPGHVRLPISDDEIIDRALAAQGLAGTPVTLLTFDTGQAMRAREAGLRVHKFTVPVGEEPPDTRGRKAKQQAAAQGGNGSTAAGAGTTD